MGTEWGLVRNNGDWLVFPQGKRCLSPAQRDWLVTMGTGSFFRQEKGACPLRKGTGS
jgi:hypothetical protein